MTAEHALPKATPKELRKFGFTIGGIFLVITLIALWRGRVVLMAFSGVMAIYLLSFAFADPEKIKGFHRAWWKGTFFVGHYMGVFWFTLIYWVLFTPVSLIARWIGFDPLGIRKHRRANSYWHDRPGALTSDHYEKQFAKMEEDSPNGT